ncbi:MAG TPA: hypothetical protein HPP83_08260 [Candidatus Hydrogenedentes bacterium]|nr:hypothetical protein [Candidatus Hydrogenedentota bacterium]
MLPLIALSTMCAQMLGAVSGPILSLDLEQGWTHRTQGAWRLRFDHRELLAMRHPWQPNRDGDFASAARSVTVPEAWRGPVSLVFYCSDDYQAVGRYAGASWLTAEGFVGHRLKQVMVDGAIAWSEDISDAVKKGESPRYRVPLPVEPGRTFLLTLLVYDAAASTTELEGDFYQSGDDTTREGNPSATNFLSNVYWGDVCLTDGEAMPPPGKRPSESKVFEVHGRRWPTPTFGDAWPDTAATLEISAPAGLPEEGFPARCGVPIHAGKAKGANDVCLLSPEGKRFPAQKSALGSWPDGSVKWVLVEFPVKPDCRSLVLGFEPDKAGFTNKAKVTEEETVIKVDARRILFECQRGDPVTGVRGRGGKRVERVQLALDVMGEAIPGHADTFQIESNGPFTCTVDIGGRFEAADRTAATFKLRCSAFADLPFLRLWFRLFNDTDADLVVSGLELRLVLPCPPEKLRVPSGEVQPGFRLVQRTETRRELNGAPVAASAPMYVAWDGGAVVVRHFRELFPKAATTTGNSIVLNLVAAKESPVIFTPGEAKSHEIWVALGDTDPAQFAAAVRQPPILQNSQYFCATGVLGPARQHHGVPVLHEQATRAYGDKQWEDLGQHFGVRHFPDSPHYGGLPNWSNNYYERMLNLWSEWFMSGDRRWYDRAVDVCRHIMDVAIVHSAIPGKDWLGAMHGPGNNHVAGPWNPNLRVAGLELYHKLTGDPDARDAFLGVADFCLRSQAGTDGGSVRQQAGPFDTICTAYAETLDPQLLDAGAARVDSVMRAMDMRRGAWPDEHGSKVYRGNIPWMAAQMARPLYLWYHATGDLDAAQALVGLAESIICENTDWKAPGAVAGYSHNPRYPVTASYDLLILPMIYAAYELTEDSFFLDAANAQWKRWTTEKSFDSILNCYWNTPWLVWYLKTYNVIAHDEPARHATASDQ